MVSQELDERLEAILPLSPVILHTLVALAEGPAHGYAVAQEVEQMTGGRVRMGPGTLYGALQRMRDDDLIEETDNPGEEGAHADRRRYYRLSPLGREALRVETAWLTRTLNLARARLGP